MRDDVDNVAQTAFKTSLIFGASGAGKTDFCASFPKVAMLGSAREGGLETVKWMDRARWYDRAAKPLLYPVSSIGDLMGHLIKDVIPMVERGIVQTICIELTFHADDAMRRMDIDDRNGWAKYANLESHIVNVDERLKNVRGARIVYNTLALPEENAKGTSGVLIPGKALARKIPAMCDLTGYMRAEDTGQGIDRVLHLSAYGNYSPRHRYGARLPAVVRNPTFRILEDLLAGRARSKDDGTVTYDALPLVSVPGKLPPLKR